MRPLLVTLFIAFSTHMAYANPVETIEQGFKKTVDSAFKEAFRIIRSATERTSFPELKAVGQKMLAKESYTVVSLAPKGFDWSACEEGGGAFLREKDIIEGHSEIFVCKQDLEWMSLAQTTQLLIHEIVHLSGVISECETSSIEIGIIKALNMEEAYENRYKGMCEDLYKYVTK